MSSLKRELKDILMILKDKQEFKDEIYNRYCDCLTSIDDLIGDNEEDFSKLFYFVNRHFLYLLDNNPDVSIREKDILFRRKFHKILKMIGPKMLGCTQVMENRNFLNNPDSSIIEPDKGIKLPNKPVIYVANHGFRDDVLATVLAANRHAYIYWGSLPLFYNSTDGLASSLVGEVIMNRKVKESRKSSLDKSSRVMDYGTDLIMFSEGGWNKTSEVPVLDLWPGVYKLSCSKKCAVVPITHYVRDLEIVDKKNVIHTVVDEPIPLYELSERDALVYLRDNLASWQYKMAEQYGKSTREEEMVGFTDSVQKWNDHLIKRMSGVIRYDSSIEKQSDYRPKDIYRPEDVFKQIANIKEENINAMNIKSIEEAKKLVKVREESDFQRLY